MDCGNDQVEISFGGFSFEVIPLNKIVIDERELSARVSKMGLKKEL